MSKNKTPHHAKLLAVDYKVNGIRARVNSGEFMPPRWITDDETNITADIVVILCVILAQIIDVCYHLNTVKVTHKEFVKYALKTYYQNKDI
eukprot:gene21821-28239_t